MTGALSAQHIEQVYRDSCKHEGYINIYLYRRLSIFLAVGAAILHRTPNQVTILSFAFSFLSAAFFSTGDFATSVWALVPFHIGKVLDCADGQLAALANKKSAKGAFLDPFLDRIADIAILTGLAVGFYQSTQSNLCFYLLIATLAGWFISAYLNIYSDKNSKSVDTLRSLNTKVPKSLSRLMKWDGGFTGLVTTVAVLTNQIPLLILLIMFVVVLPLPLQLVSIYRKLGNESR